MAADLKNEVATTRPAAASIFIGGFLTLIVLGVGYLSNVLLISFMRTAFGGLLPLVHSLYSMTLIGTGWYMLGRFFVALPSWRPGSRQRYSWPAVLHCTFNFLVVASAVVPAGLVLGVMVSQGLSRATWELPLLIAGLVSGHFAWMWANPRADRIVRMILPRVSQPPNR